MECSGGVRYFQDVQGFPYTDNPPFCTKVWEVRGGQQRAQETPQGKLKRAAALHLKNKAARREIMSPTILKALYSAPEKTSR